MRTKTGSLIWQPPSRPLGHFRGATPTPETAMVRVVTVAADATSMADVVTHEITATAGMAPPPPQGHLTQHAFAGWHAGPMSPGVYDGKQFAQQQYAQHSLSTRCSMYVGAYIPTTSSSMYQNFTTDLAKKIRTIPTLTYTTSPLKAPTIALFSPQYRPKSPRPINPTPKRKVLDQTKYHTLLTASYHTK